MEIFRREEKKYFLTDEQYKLLTNKISKYLKNDIHGISTISNIYFDNDNNEIIIKSLERPIYKEKVRLRGYGKIDLDSYVYLEIKKKYKGIVGKRRIKLKLSDYYNYYNNNVIPYNNQIMKEIDYCFKKYKLKPKLFLAYDRIAYYAKDDNNFRLTFDYNIRSSYDDLCIEKVEKTNNLYDNNYYIMEVKSLNSMPIWFIKVISDLKIYPVSFSKYGTIYGKEVIKNV